MQVIVNKLLTSYEEVGDGKKTILFLHGWADGGKSFQGLAKEILKCRKNYRAIMLDLPGFGGTQAPADAWGLDEYAGFVDGFLRKISVKTDVIVGHSNGGAIAMRGLATDVFDADRLVLIASAGIRRPSLKKSILRMLAKPAKLAVKIAPASAQRRIRQKLYRSIGSDYLIVEKLQETFKRVVSTDVTKDSSKLKLPTLIIYGEADESTPPLYGEIFHDSIKASQLHIIPEAGHFVHHEQLYKTASIIEDFLS